MCKRCYPRSVGFNSLFSVKVRSLVKVVGLVVVAVGAGIGCAVLPPKLELPERATTMSEVEPYLRRAVERGEPPGLSVGVIKGGETVYSGSWGYADGPRGLLTTADTVYQWWSLTKLFTAVAILQLEERAKLRLDDPVSKHLPFLEGKIRDVTIRQLLSHGGGVDDIGMSILGWIHFEGDQPKTQTELIREKHAQYSKLVAAPGVEGRYSNFGYILLAGVVESVARVSYESFVTDSILRPLKMEHTGFTYTEAMRPFEAAGTHPRDLISYIVPIYIDTDRAVREKKDGILWFNRVYSDQKGSTGLIGSVSDLLRFMKALLRGGELNGKRILSSANIALMQKAIVEVKESPAPDNEGYSFGLAWFVSRDNGEVALTHGGAGMAFVTSLCLYPERELGIVVIANSTYLGRAMGLDLVDLLGRMRW